MTDLSSAGRLRHLIEAILWSGFLILAVAIGLSSSASGEHPRLRPAKARPAEQWVNLEPRPILDPELAEQLSRLSYIGP